MAGKHGKPRPEGQDPDKGGIPKGGPYPINTPQGDGTWKTECFKCGKNCTCGKK